MPAGFEDRLMSVLRSNREIELGKPAGTLLSSGVRILGRAIVIELLNGHTVVHKSVCDVSTGQVMIDDYYNDPNFIENGDSALVLSGNAMRLLSKSNKKSEGENSTTTTEGEIVNAVSSSERPSKISLGGLADQSASLLGSDSSLLLLNYTPHPCMAISISLQYAVAETTFTDAQSLGVAQRMYQRIKKRGTFDGASSSSSSSSTNIPSEEQSVSNTFRNHSAHEIRSAAAATLFGGARLEQQRTILIGKQVFVPFQMPTSKSTTTSVKDDKIKPRLVFANRSIRGKKDPNGEFTYTRRTLEVPLRAPNPSIENTRSVYLNGIPQMSSSSS